LWWTENETVPADRSISEIIINEDQLKVEDLVLLHQLLANYRPKLLELLQNEMGKSRDKSWTEEELLFQTLDVLGPPPKGKVVKKPHCM
jgi:hypothetical protein